jgi:hypothetical protein
MIPGENAEAFEKRDSHPRRIAKHDLARDITCSYPERLL